MTKSSEIKPLVIKHRAAGWSIGKLASTFGVHASTIKRCLGTIKPQIRKKRRHAKVIDAWMKTRIKRALHGVANKSTRSVARELTEKGYAVSHQTVWRVAKSLGLRKKKNRKTFALTPAQAKKRVDYAKTMLGASHAELVFVDESYIELVSPPNCHNDGTWLFIEDKEMQVPIPKYTTKINVLAGISLKGASRLVFFDGTMNSAKFTHYMMLIIRDMKKLHGDDELTVVMDSATCHRSNHTTTWLNRHGVKAFDKFKWPAASPDFNPIENVWSTLQSRVLACKPQNKSQMMKKAKVVWSRMDAAEIASYIHALPARYQQVIQTKGMQT